jgi:hypothetical protein
MHSPGANTGPLSATALYGDNTFGIFFVMMARVVEKRGDFSKPPVSTRTGSSPCEPENRERSAYFNGSFPVTASATCAIVTASVFENGIDQPNRIQSMVAVP